MSVLPFSKVPSSRGVALAIASACAVFATGCGVNNFNTASTPVTAFVGAVHGGQSPIQGATVNLYVTNSAATGYGQAGTFIGTGKTDAAGGFSIAPSATAANCPAGQQAYITAAGGYPTGTPTLANNSSLLMAALGTCANVNANTFVIINEVTTVAAGYALSGFMTTSAATGGLFQANVSAPAANNAATGTGTVAAGLPHAFLNAALLANVTGGVANSQTPNISMAGNNLNGNVPAVEINTLGDILQPCVNGATGNAQCQSLFTDTPSISGVAPTNTLQAMINLARNPYPSAAAMTGTTSLFSLASSIPAFQPTLTTAPPDWSLAIVYKSTALVGPYDLALDANDTVYQGASGSANLLAMSTYSIATPAFTAGTAGTATRQLALDTHNNAFVTNNGGLLLQYNTASGGAPSNVVSQTGAAFYGVAVDKSGNVWLANSTASATPNIAQYTYPSYAAGVTATGAGGFSPYQLTIDANQNVWVAAYNTNGSLAQVLPNLTPTAAASYAASGTTATPISATFASSAIKPLGLVIDASANAWYGITGTTTASNTVTTTGIEEVTPTLTNFVITGLNPQPLVANATLGAKASQIPGIDGAGTIYLPDNQGTGALGIHAYSSVAVSSSDTASQVLSPPSGYLGCYLATATTTTCGTGSASAVYNPREIAIDSTGSVWGGITSGGLTQLIGLGAPTWPLLATTKPGLSPGLTTVTALP